MLKKFVILIVFCYTSAKGQSFVSEINVNIPKKSEAFQFQDPETKNTFLFFDNKEIISSYKLDENLKVVDSIQTNKEKEKIESIIGYAKKEATYYTYWSSKDKKTIYVLSYDFEKKESYVAPINFDIGKEYLINKIVIQNKFYIVTATKNTNNIHFYCFTDKTFSKKTISLNDCVFYDYQQNKISFYDLVSKIAMSTYGGVQNISEDNPASLAFASRDKKSYVKDNSLIFAFDNNKNYTQFLKFNLDDYKYEYKLFSQPYFAAKEGSNETFLSNSFYVNNNLIQLKTNFSILNISIKDMNRTEIKSLNITLDKEIDFKNSDIIQENMSIRNPRVLDKSKQFLRRMTLSNLAASCYFENDTYYLTLGSVSDVQNQNLMYGAMFGAAGVLLSYALTSNYTMDNLESYNDRVVIYINCLFDKNFNHIEGVKKQLAFDKLRLHMFENKLNNHVAFKLNDKLIYGGTRTNKKYFFYSFSDN
jgi:hypothetical protein